MGEAARRPADVYLARIRQRLSSTRERHIYTLAIVRKPSIAAIAVVLLLVVAGLRYVDLRAARQDAIAAAEARADNLALILSAYIGESFRAADAALRQLQVHSSRIGGPAAPPSDWVPTLTSAKAGLTGVGAITVISNDGMIRHSTRPEIVGQSRRDEYLTRQVFEASNEELVIGTPFPTLPGPGAPSQLIIPIGRRLSSAAGVPEGSIVASFRPEAPRALLREVNLWARGIITVFHPEGVVLFREPADADAMGQPADSNPIFAAAKQERGVLEAALEPDGPVMLTAFRRTATPPLVVSVSVDRGAVLAAWRRDLFDSAAVFAVIALLLAGGLFVLFRQMDAKQAAERALALAAALEKEHLREANERLASALAREHHAREQAESASALKDDFLMTVSHELRTPLTAIYGWARLLNQGAVSERQRQRAVETIERNAQAQTRLIDDLLDVSGVATGKLRIDVKPLQPADVVQNALETASPAARAKAITIDAEIDPSVGPMLGDPERLQQVVWNLLANAVKFTPNGGAVRVTVAHRGDDLVIAVRDSGVGISPDFLPHVFDRFRQEDSGSRRRYGGLGLGLAIVRNLVELHGGTVSAASDGVGKGATFTVTLPLMPAATSAGRMRPALDTGSVRRLDGVSILIVDDDPEALELFGTVLASAGADVTPVGSAAAALAKIHDRAFDVLLSDIEMPEVDGYALGHDAAAIARSRGNPLVAIAVTAYSRPEDEERSRAAGFVRHLSKPVDPATLVAVIADSAPERV
jgi:signal transduction histidine kinase